MFIPTMILTALLAQPAPDKPAWQSLFDGKTLGNWKKTTFAGGGDARLEKKFKDKDPAIVVEAGSSLSGFNWVVEKKAEDAKTTDDANPNSKAQNPKSTDPIDLPKTNYELELEFLKIDGTDFACGLTFPVGDSHASLILGGWGGGVVGISSIDSHDASENETTKYMGFKKDQWYKVRLKVTPDKLEAWVDDKQVVEAEIKGKKISLRSGDIDKSRPLGIATFQTSAAFRGIRLRRLEGK